ncbi:hypothetical protein MSG28_007409 [Choristoneura fumiferana]|uniref:Uncharacterized protein n=1 Tax=Choristoneura fumiferana TaxID=7141 RepID=A0ACC0JX46_CHOFU|nr:hypothetical protein MSG28_007409 [Choristoneura fumiferana]
MMAVASAGETEPLRAQEETPKLTLRQRISYVSKHITVEPAGVLVLSASIFAAVCTQTLQLEKACRVNLNLGDEICTSLRNQDSDNNTQYEIKVQQYVATRLAWRSAIQSVIPCIILIFVGAWSDMTGRRIIVIMVPLFGEILQCISNIINVIFFDELPVEVLIFFDVFFPAILGGWSTLFLGLFSYMGDITTVENRTHRLGFVQFCTFVGLPIGMGLSGVVLKKFGYYAVYGTSLIIHLINVTYISLRLKDPERTKEQKKETIRVVFKKGPNKRRLRMIVLLSVVSILFGPIFGELAVLYMSTRYRFGWDELQFSMFQTYNFVTHTLGTVFSLVVFSKALKWHDSVLGIISTVTPLVEMLNGTSLLAMRSIISKLVASDELGKVNSIFGLTENLMPLLYVPLYTTVYTATMEVLPGAVFLMGATMTTPAVAVFLR